MTLPSGPPRAGRPFRPPAPPAGPEIRSLEELGAHVRHARGRMRLRLDDAAALCGVSVDLLSRLENGRPVTTDRLLKVLARLDLAWLVMPSEQAWHRHDGAFAPPDTGPGR